MKKLFTLLALLTCFLGVKAVEVEDAYVDFSKYSDISEWHFPNSWGGSESARARLSIVDGCLHFESTEATDPSWDCQFFPIGGVAAEVGTVYTLHFKIKGDHVGNVSMLGFGQTPYGQFGITTDWVEGTVDYEATSGDGNILMQCGDWVGTWDIAYLKITHEEKNTRPIEWIELLTNGDAETPWGDLANVKFTDTENTINVVAWGKEKGVNMNDDGGWDPFPATIEDDGTGNHVFVVHGKVADTEGDASAWDNQFWIMSPKELKVGSQYKVKFRYKASEAANTNTQMHSAQPSDYLHWQVLGDINFSTEWQEYDQKVTIPTPQNDKPIYSIAFNLNPANKNAVDFYFDDLSICEMKLDHGFFVAPSNASKGIEYNFDEAIEFTQFDDLLSATVGTLGDEDSWINEVMISTVRGYDGAFKGSTIKPSGTVVNDPDTWLDYTEASNYKIKLPAAGVWTISIDEVGKQINFIKLEGEADKDPVDIAINPTEIIINGVERDDIKSDDFPEGTGNAWDNQFFIVANRALDEGEVTVIKFSYMASKDDVKVTTQDHGEPGGYLHWDALGDLNFTGSWQDYTKEFTVPKEANGMKSFAFNMAEIKEACDYYVKNVQWYLKDDYNESGKTMENLINATGSDNFYVKVGAGTNPYIYGKEDGINDIVTKNSNASNAIFNVAGQKVDKNYKGLVIKNGKKMIQD